MFRKICIVCSVAATLLAEPYELGHGLKVGEFPLYVGGYVTADYLQRQDDYHRLRVDDIALLAYGSSGKFSYLSELEIKDSYVKEWGKVDEIRHDDEVSIERAHFDYAYSDTTEWRIGKFNTPAGYWNLVPINVLRDSASNPYLAYILYPRYTTGVQVTYEDHLGGGNRYTTVVQNNNDLDDDYNNIFIDRHVAAGVEHVGERLSYKANAGYFRTEQGLEFGYALLALQYERERYRITGEIGARRGESEWSVPYAGYLQGVYRMAVGHDLIGRFESYKVDEGARREEQIGVLGYTYRPLYPVALKAEYQWHTYVNENQLHLSFAVLF